MSSKPIASSEPAMSPASNAPTSPDALDPPSLQGVEADSAAQPAPLEREPIGPKLSFWQDPVVQNYLPLGTSIAFHLILIIGAILTYKTYEKITQPAREQVIIPEAAIVEGGEVGGIPNPGLGGDPNLAAAQNVDPNVSVSDNWAQRRSESLTSTLMNGGASDDAVDSVIGLGSHAGLAGLGTPGPGGEGAEGGQALAPFGVPGGGQGLGPKSPFMGISGNARKVVYICDASGSMMDVFPRVRDELRKAVSILKPIQAFNVIFFSDVAVTALSKNDLLMATPDNKRKAFELSQRMSSAGSTDPLPAIRLAFEQKPELIYVLTDGFENVVSFDAVINEFKKLNAEKRVKVNVILIRSSNSAELEKVAKTIASQNGGICKIIDRRSI